MENFLAPSFFIPTFLSILILMLVVTIMFNGRVTLLKSFIYAACIYMLFIINSIPRL